jgi:hypothetical protein
MQSEAGRDRVWNFLEGYQKCLDEVNLVVTATVFKHFEVIGVPNTEWHEKLEQSGFSREIRDCYPRACVAFKGRKAKAAGS